MPLYVRTSQVDSTLLASTKQGSSKVAVRHEGQQSEHNNVALRVTVVAAGGRTDGSNVTTVAFAQAKVAPPDAMPRGNLSQAHAATVLTAGWMPA